MAVKRVSPEEARDLMDKEGYVYLDVRSVPEFEAGHPTGAYNVPLAHMGGGGMTPNPDFLSVVENAFPKDARLVVGCKSGGRSAKAATLLEQAGFRNVIDQGHWFDGSPSPTGGLQPGWRPRGLPVSQQAEPGRTYDALQSRTR
jgi:rhodanese-related sulfurtransferase